MDKIVAIRKKSHPAPSLRFFKTNSPPFPFCIDISEKPMACCRTWRAVCFKKFAQGFTALEFLILKIRKFPQDFLSPREYFFCRQTLPRDMRGPPYTLPVYLVCRSTTQGMASNRSQRAAPPSQGIAACYQTGPWCRRTMCRITGWSYTTCPGWPSCFVLVFFHGRFFCVIVCSQGRQPSRIPILF